MNIDKETLDSLFSYDPYTGALVHKTRAANCVQIGDIAGSRHEDASGLCYVRLSIKRKRHMAHRIIYAMLGIQIPSGMVIDHIDGNGENNRLSNLRTVSHVGNCHNMHITRSRNKEKKIGVLRKTRKDGSCRWVSKITIPNPSGTGSGKIVHLGTYDTEKEADESYRVAKAKFHQTA